MDFFFEQSCNKIAKSYMFLHFDIC